MRRKRIDLHILRRLMAIQRKRTTMMNHEQTTFEFWIGGFFCQDRKVFFEGGSMVYELQHPGGYGESDERIEIQLGQEEWLNFWDALERIGVWQWRRKYTDNDILDGTQWKLDIDKDGQKISVYGSNEFPESFQDFTDALNSLFDGQIKL
ncbi:MAG: hypothetical protein GC154_21200 [bacterium]|nr:hypothetical protein [bacterium]